MDSLNSYSVKQLKNIVVTHNASEKINVIKAYGKMKKPELVKAISKQIKQEHLMKILDALKMKRPASPSPSPPASPPKTPTMDLNEMMDEPETIKIKVKKQPKKMDTKLVEEMLMMMEEGGSKVAEKIRKSGMIDEMTAKQEEAIVEDFMKMIESQGGMMTEKGKKNVAVKPPSGSSAKEEAQNVKDFMRMIEKRGQKVTQMTSIQAGEDKTNEKRRMSAIYQTQREEQLKKDGIEQYKRDLKRTLMELRRNTRVKLAKSLKAGYKPNDEEKFLKDHADEWLRAEAVSKEDSLFVRSPENNLKFVKDTISFLRRVAKERDERIDKHDYGITPYWESLHRHYLWVMKLDNAKVPEDYEYYSELDKNA
jgi:hypothetical protein